MRTSSTEFAVIALPLADAADTANDAATSAGEPTKDRAVGVDEDVLDASVKTPPAPRQDAESSDDANEARPEEQRTLRIDMLPPPATFDEDEENAIPSNAPNLN